MANMAERISKVKFKDGEWVIHTCQPLDEGNKDAQIKLRAQPHPDMPMAFQALEAVVREVWELPESYAKDKITIIGVSFSQHEESEVEGACVTALVSLDTSGSPGVLNTPHLPYEQYNEGGVQPTLSQDAIHLLETFRSEAAAYMTGRKRLQADMFARAA